MIPKLSGIFALLLTVVPIASAIVYIGIQRDYDLEFGMEPRIESYSGIIRFFDPSIPGQVSQMSDGQFINLARRAYDEMVALWNNYNLPPNLLPGSMIAMESQGYVYFASSIRKLDGSVDLNAPDWHIVNSPGWFSVTCMTARGPHRLDGACAEPSVARLYGDKWRPVPEIPNEPMRTPPKYPKPRIAVWGRRAGQQPFQGVEQYFRPCRNPEDGGWGCEEFAEFYAFNPVQNRYPDPAGEDEWQFTRERNPRICH